MAFSATTHLRKKFWDCWFFVPSPPGGWTNTNATWGTKIGQLDGEAAMKLSAGDTQKLATGIEAQISENGEVPITIVGDGASTLFADNYAALVAIINLPVNIMFEVPGSAPTSAENVKMSGMYIYPELSIQANQINKINIIAKREFAAGTGVALNQANNQ